MEKARFNSRALIPIATAIIAAVFIGVGLKDFGFWDDQPTAAFFPIIIAVVLLATSLLCLVQKAIIIIEVFMAALILGVFVFWMQVQFPMGLFAYLM